MSLKPILLLKEVRFYKFLNARPHKLIFELSQYAAAKISKLLNSSQKSTVLAKRDFHDYVTSFGIGAGTRTWYLSYCQCSH